MLQTLFARHGAAQMGAHTGTPIAEGVQSSPFSMCTAYSYTHTGMCSHLRGARYARPASELVTVSQAEPPPDTPTPGPGTRQRAWRGIPYDPSGELSGHGALYDTLSSMSALKVGYARVSTDEQDLTAQREVTPVTVAPKRRSQSDLSDR